MTFDTQIRMDVKPAEDDFSFAPKDMMLWGRSPIKITFSADQVSFTGIDVNISYKREQIGAFEAMIL